MSETFELADLLKARAAVGQPYHEFLVRASLSTGIYRLEPGRPDRQQPHTEDEIYYVLEGTGAIDIDGTVTPVRPGSVIFVEQGVPHHFRDYPDGLTLLVVFAPARGSMAQG